MAQPRLPPSSVSTVPDTVVPDPSRRLGGAVAGAGLPVAGTGEEVAADPSRSVGATGVRRARSRRSSDQTHGDERQNRKESRGPAVAARSVSAAAAETVLSTRNAPTARRGRRAQGAGDDRQHGDGGDHPADEDRFVRGAEGLDRPLLDRTWGGVDRAVGDREQRGRDTGEQRGDRLGGATRGTGEQTGDAPGDDRAGAG